MNSLKIVSVLAVVCLALTTGCSIIPGTKANSAKNQPPPATPPIVVNTTPVQAPQVPTAGYLKMRLPDRAKWSEYSVFNNIIIPLPGANKGSGGTVLVRNHRNERIALQISDHLVGLVDEPSAPFSVMILPPGESYALKDPGLGAVTNLNALVIDAHDACIGFIPIQVKWKSGEAQWDILGGTPVTPLPPGADPMKLLPKRSIGGPSLQPVP